MPNKPQSKAIIIILSSPSGGGKSSVAQSLLMRNPNLVLSVSATTRKPRPKDVDGINYFFKRKKEFKALIHAGEFIEYAEIYGNLYGTPRKYVEEQLKAGFDVLFDIDCQGMHKIKEKMSYRAVSIFTFPPSLEILRQRIEKRATDDVESINLRMKLAEKEIDQAKNYDYIVINDKFEKTVEEIESIITNERDKRK